MNNPTMTTTTRGGAEKSSCADMTVLKGRNQSLWDRSFAPWIAFGAAKENLPDMAESCSEAALSSSVGFLFWKIDFKSKTKAVSACPVNARVSACLRVPGASTVVCTRCECLWVCLQGVFQHSSFIHLLSNWPPEARWAGREADQLIGPLTPHSPHLTLPDSPAYLSAFSSTNHQPVAASLAVASLDSLHLVAPNKQMRPSSSTPLLDSVVECLGRSHSALKDGVIFPAGNEQTLLVEARRQTDRLTKPSRSKPEVSVGVELQVFADDAAVTERCGDKALVFAGSLCTPHGEPWQHPIRVRPDPLVASLLLNLACPHPLSVTVSLPFTLCQPSSEAVLIYPIPHKQAANEPEATFLLE